MVVIAFVFRAWRSRHLDDHQVPGAKLQLSDAQELVARRLGFEGWQALKAAGLPCGGGLMLRSLSLKGVATQSPLPTMVLPECLAMPISYCDRDETFRMIIRPR
jgi:hypothetical protein